MTDRGDANLPQIVSSQRWQNLPIDLVFGKGRHCPRPRPFSHSAMFTASPGFSSNSSGARLPDDHGERERRSPVWSQIGPEEP